MRLHPGDHLVGPGDQIALGGREVLMTQVRLDVDERHRRVARQAQCAGMTKIMGDHVAAGLGVQPVEDAPQGRVVERPERAAQSQPDRPGRGERFPLGQVAG